MARACVLNIAVIAWFWSDWELGAAWAEETGKKTNKRKHKGGLVQLVVGASSVEQVEVSSLGAAR